MTQPLRRLHPLTPFIRGWKIFVAFAVVVAQQVGLERHGPARWALLALAGAVPVAAVAGWLAWRTTTYGFDGEDLRVDSGIVVRRSRRVRLDRLQAVDVVRPLLARLVGLAELRLEVVGASSSEGGLAYLSEEEARALRAELLARAAGLVAAEHADPAAGAPVHEEAPEHLLHAVPWGRYVASLVLSAPTLVAGLVIGAAVALSAWQRTAAPLALVLPALVVPVQQFFVRGQADAGFEVSGSADGLRLRHGLLESRQQTVPPGRVQAIRVVAPVLWRPWGWVRLEVAVAGYGQKAQALTGTLLPVAPRAEAEQLVRLVLGAEVGPADHDRLAVPLVPAPRRARWLDPLGWRALGVGGDDEVLLARHGAFRVVLDVVPHAKVQSLRVVQGPLQRRLGLVTLHVDLPPHIAPLVPHRDAAEAAALLATEVERTRAARARARPERWAQPAGGRSAGL
ncbi:putative membrane protein [Motilibacter peucedani]|uniref:Putative membrane protein n=1 Tax=Motilibacter peucedani TaxID=598650 RepID=A0A420XPS1_9ACTN|nr:PH domain-containing protein [Motilibacter peucedani]RKS75263.1 putative membrane protein [Motilibacter peucedani]